MPQRGGRVPQFGKWEDGPNAAAYTMIFESARKDKNGEPKLLNPNEPEATGTVAAAAAAAKDRPPAPPAARAPRFIINPNDPEQNPQAFRTGAAAFAQEYRHVKQEYPDRTPPRDAANRQKPARGGTAGYGMEQQPYRSSRNNNTARSSNDASDYNGSHFWQRQGTAGRRPPEPAAGGAYGLITTPSPSRPQGTPGRRAAVPKFGGWDETDPATSEGYTMVFNRVKEDKHTAHAFPAPLLSDEPETYHERPSGYKPRKSFWAKLFCCFTSSVH